MAIPTTRRVAAPLLATALLLLACVASASAAKIRGRGREGAPNDPAAGDAPGQKSGRGGPSERGDDELLTVDMDKVVDKTRQQWGLVEVRPGAHLFYWLYATRAPTFAPSARPLVLWLQGGPGVSASGYGNFEELGSVDTHLHPRNLSWVNDVNVLFVDSPVGTGFSYVESPDLLAASNTQVAEDLMTFTRTFLERHPIFRLAPLYIFAEAYGGKMAAEFTLQLARAVQAGSVKINLKGLAMGDPWIAPVDAIQSWASYLLYLGLVEQRGHERISEAAEAARAAAERGEWAEATSLWNSTEWLVLRETGGINMRNVLTRVSSRFRQMLARLTDVGAMGAAAAAPPPSHRSPEVQRRRRKKERESSPEGLDRAWTWGDGANGRESDSAMDIFMNKRVAPRLELDLPIGQRWTGVSREVFAALAEDFMKPAIDSVEALLNETSIEVTVLNSQLDVFANSKGTMDWMQRLRWPGAEMWPNAPRNTLPIAGAVAGDRKTFGNLAVYWLRNVGQMLVVDNPAIGQEILRRVTKFDQDEIFDYVSDRF